MQKFKPAESAKQIRPGIQVYTVNKNPEKNLLIIMQWLYIKYIFIGLLTHTFKLKPAFPYYTIFPFKAHCELLTPSAFLLLNKYL